MEYDLHLSNIKKVKLKCPVLSLSLSLSLWEGNKIDTQSNCQFFVGSLLVLFLVHELIT
jgi:hypothetical protein